MSIPYSFNPLGASNKSGDEGYFTIVDGTGTNEYSFSGNLDTLTVGDTMFSGYKSMTSFAVKLPNLTTGREMFRYCSKMIVFTAELPNLTMGYQMFNYCEKLPSWNSNLPNLTSGYSMFASCYNLTSYTGELPNLTNGYQMFTSCSKLTSFNAGTEGLKSLADGTKMFNNCILDKTSVLHILNTIPTYTSGSYPLHLGKNTNYQDSTDIATLLGTTVPIAAGTYNYKGWTITVQA